MASRIYKRIVGFAIARANARATKSARVSSTDCGIWTDIPGCGAIPVGLSVQAVSQNDTAISVVLIPTRVKVSLFISVPPVKWSRTVALVRQVNVRLPRIEVNMRGSGRSAGCLLNHLLNA
jgi:hypothetical protein